MEFSIDNVYRADCLAGLAQVAAGSVDLAFADPPFNIGYEYDVYRDTRPAEEYLDWSRRWMQGVFSALKPAGTFWLAIGDEFAAELKLIARRELGFACRSWVIWYYTFGVNCTRAFSRSHTHLFYFVKDPDDFTFNADNPAVRVPSARQLVYADRRANPRGRLPDNTWILRPQDVPGGFASEHDTWYFPRVAGTFKERKGFHGCQMPEQLLGRIIRCCSNPLETVLDPFAGSGTTLAVAKKLGRRWLGFELSQEYVERIRQRVKAAQVGDSLDGAADPLRSAPKTASPSRSPRRGVRQRRSPAASNGKRATRSVPSHELDAGIIDAYKKARDGCSVDHVLADPALNAAFLDACRSKGLAGEPLQWNLALLRIRKAGKLPRLGKSGRSLTFEQMDAYSFAAEIAMEQLSVEFERTLDGILCDPHLARRFDETAESYSPGFSALEYRWAALAIRKRAKRIRKAAASACPQWQDRRLPRARPFDNGDWSRYRCPGVYLLGGRDRQQLYVGETLDLSTRLSLTGRIDRWRALCPTSVTPIREDEPCTLQAVLIGRIKPLMNSRLLVPDMFRTS